MAKTVDVADFLAAGGDLDDAFESGERMVPLVERRRDELGRARASIASAITRLGAEQTSRQERSAVATALSSAVSDLAWLSVLAPQEWSHACTSLHACGGFGEHLTMLRRAVKDASRAAVEATRQEHRSRPSGPVKGVEDSLGALAADMPEGLVVPRPYSITPDGTFLARERPDGELVLQRIAQRPIVIVKLGSDLDDDTHSVVVRWLTPQGWRSRPVSRKTIAVSRLLAEESENGLPVTSENAKLLVGYFDAFLGENERRLPRTTTTRSMGWKPGGFLCGAVLVGPDGPVDAAGVELSRLDAGLAQAIRPYHQAGTWEGWTAAVRSVAHLPRVMLSLLASMAPPLLRHIPGATNGILDWAGESSGGKTSVLRVGASVWGRPDDDGAGIIHPWEASATYVERLAALSSDLPVFLDDTKRVVRKEDIGKMLYMVAQGQGRGRGNLKSIDVTATWRTFLLSTGEAPATSYAPEGGAAARCLTVWGEPFDAPSQSVEARAALAESVKVELLANYGHLGPRLVAWLQQPGRVETVRGWYRSALQQAAAAATNNVARRISAHVALLSVCADIAAELGVPGPSEPIWPVLQESVAAAAVDADKATEALVLLHGYAVSMAQSFYGRHVVYTRWDGQDKIRETRVPNGGWLGCWKSQEWDYIGFQKGVLETFLTDRGYDAKAIIRTWRGRGWLKTNPGTYTASLPMPSGQRPNGYCILKSGFVKAVGEDVVEPISDQQEMFDPYT